MGFEDPCRPLRGGRGPAHQCDHGGSDPLTDLEALFRENWSRAVATTTRLCGDLTLAEDAVQEACLAALAQWPTQGVPGNPGGWLIATARHKALDALRREIRRRTKDEAAARDLGRLEAAEQEPMRPIDDDELALVFLCCHPALGLRSRVALTLRSVCGLATAEIAHLFLVPEATMAQTLVRAKRKIRHAAIPFRVPGEDTMQDRVPSVLRVVYLVFTEGHRSTGGPDLVREDFCEEAIRLGRLLARLLPGEPEVLGLLALMLLTDARRPTRVDADGVPVLLEAQDRRRWDPAKIDEGSLLLDRALATGRPGPYQLQAAIAACHSTAPAAGDTDWPQIALLYGELARYEPSPVVEANRAVAVAMAGGPEAGLAILTDLVADPQLARWPQLHVARAELLARLGRPEEAAEANRTALALEPPAAEATLIDRRIAELEARS